MDYDNARPAKRVRLELAYDECQLEHSSISLSPQGNGNPNFLHDEQMGLARGSLATSDVTCSQVSECLTDSRDLVCFGSVTSFSVSMVDRVLHQVNLQVNDVGQLCRPDQTTCGSLAKRDFKILKLLKKEGIESDLLWVPASKAASDQLGMLWLTIYGARELASDVGDTLQEVEVYLQEPIYAERNTLYWNPQRFQNTEGLYTAMLKCDAPVKSHLETFQFEATDVLKEFTSEDNMPETKGSILLRTVLKSHQRRGLTFMLRREQGWQLDTKNGDIWSRIKDEAGNPAYLNNIDNSQQHECPVPFRGGIIADDMGMGKTLSMIALIAHDRPVSPEPTQKQTTTLVVVPPTRESIFEFHLVIMYKAYQTVLSNWETELRERTSPGHLSWFLYHGPGRALGSYSFSEFDIIFTTYSTLAREWLSKGGKTKIFTYHWHRVILDEAHIIKNSVSATAQATYALDADCRWAVTATPIQNRLSELFSLLRFLRLYSYNEPRGLDMGSDNPRLGIARLKTLLRFTMLRRLSDILHLPKRTDIVVPLEFEEPDQARYDKAKQATVQYLDNIISSEDGSNGYMNAISKLNALRMMCNLGCSADAKAALSESGSKTPLERESFVLPPASMDQMLQFDDLTESASTCTICGVLILASPSPGPDNHVPPSTTNMGPIESMTGTGSNQCRTCLSDSIGVLENSHDGAAMLQLVPQLQCNGTPQGDQKSNGAFSTKVKALVSDLTIHRQASKSIVFSFWKSTLDLASLALQKARFTCLQVDGDVPANQRGAILKTFSELNAHTVLLMSLSCGAVGLNLTAASRAYLMEPQWNPAIEEQALARVYRLGQSKPVVTVRFFVKESIEEYVRQVQEAKQELVDMLLSSNRAEGNSKVMELRNFLS